MISMSHLGSTVAPAVLLMVVACSSDGGGGGAPSIRETTSAAVPTASLQGATEAQVTGSPAYLEDPLLTIPAPTGTAEAGRTDSVADHPGDATPSAENGTPDPKAGRADIDAAAVPAGLALPFDAGAGLEGREFMSPFGVYRKSADRPEFGHSGIDVPMANGTPIFAVADGRISSVEPTVDRRPGDIVQLLLGEDRGSTSGWIFIYEHISLDPGIELGTPVTRGQQIGTNALATGENNNHLQLTFVFNEQGFTRDHTCWVDRLADGARAGMDRWFETLKASDFFLSGWRTAIDEGYFPLRGLLDEAAYPDGPQLCYEQGTDVRESL